MTEDEGKYGHLPAGFHFDDKNHAYFLDGRRLPGVTEILTATNFVKQNGFWTDEGRDKGKRLHKFCADIDMGKLDWGEVDQDIMEEVNAYEEWKDRSGFIASFTERALYSAIHQYAGTPDVFGAFPDGTYAVIDRKRGAAGKATALQLAAYVQLICESRGKLHPFQVKRFALRGFSGGPPVIELYPDRLDHPVFLGLVSGFHWGFNKGIFKF